jgi:hypothetical protein
MIVTLAVLTFAQATPLEGDEDPDLLVVEQREANAPSWFERTRLRAGGGAWTGAGVVGNNPPVALFGASLRAGVATEGGAAFLVQGQAAITSALTGAYAVAGMAELTVFDRLTVGAGLGAVWSPGGPMQPPLTGTTVGLLVGVPFRIAFDFSARSRHTLALALDGWVGKERDNKIAGFSGYFAFGLSYDLM